MDSNSFNLTQENKTNDTSLTSSEDGFVYLNGTKTKGTMTGKMDLIPKMGKNKGMHSVKAKPIKERLMEFVGLFGKLFKKSPQKDIEAQKPRTSWRCDCLSSINKDCLTSIFCALLVFLSTIFFILCFMLILTVFWGVFKKIVFESPFLGKFWIVHAIASIFGLLSALLILLLTFHKILISCPFNSFFKDLLSAIYITVAIVLIVIFFILAFVFILILFYLLFENIIFADTFTGKRIVPAMLTLVGFFGSLICYFSVLYISLVTCPLIKN